jgi:AcrR family transcriptional regulator
VSGRVEQGQATRQQIVVVATDLFARHGYEGTSIEAVLAASEVSRGALYHHFASKEALFEAVLERVEQGIAKRIVAAASVGPDAVGRLRAGCLAWLRIAEDPTAQQIALIDAPSVVGWQKWREIDGRYAFGLLKGALAAVAAEGRIRPELVEVLAHMLLAALLELALVIARADKPRAALKTGEAAVDELLQRLVAPA